jgi:hypothetical protein
VALIHNGIYSVAKKNEILSFAGKWMEVDYIPKTNAVILLGNDHTLRGECTWEA